MQRRTLLKGTAVAGVAALGAGFWALPGGPRPAALSL
ncbi:MAG TPA: twin-arginine translocation signal domain-containing protein, partial [Pseudomonas oleovorans]|nr:twin-arginine translocation signal domain-containing protein [Pseudomonas oleovorans]